MLLHLAEDEKFIDAAIDHFEAVYPNGNIYYIQPVGRNDELKFVKTNHPNIIAKSVDSAEFRDLTRRLDSFDAVILHNYYTPYKKKVVEEASEKVHFHWICWGADLYSVPGLSKMLYLKKTQKYIYHQLSFKGRIKRYLEDKLFPIVSMTNKQKNNLLRPYRENYNSYEKIKSVSTVLPVEYDLIRKYISNKIEYKPFHYGRSEKNIRESSDSICSGNNFLIGNSATETNNHLDMFDILECVRMPGVKFYFPLSYGNKKYGRYIEEKGRKVFKDAFYPLTDFMPLEEYDKLMSMCGNIVMNHIRQQGMGNVAMGLRKGARIFLNPESIIYNFLKREGFIVYKIEDLKEIGSLLSFNELATHNRPLIERKFSRKQVLKDTEDLVRYLTIKDHK